MILESWPEVIGHRGAAMIAPENTVAGARAAASAGAAMIEFDAKLSADGVAMVMHDDTVDRTTDGIGPFAGKSLGALRALDAGGWFDPAFAGERIPTLADMLVACLDLGLAANIEIKPTPGREDDTARTVLETATSIWPAGKPAPLISSFQRRCLTVAAEIMPDWPRGYLIDRLPEDWRAFADAIAAATVNISDTMATPPVIAAIADTGRAVMVYTVNDPIRGRELLNMGAASVITDCPDRLLVAL
jgi:glycerophosphoryl diester phosphodiesterase